MKPRRRLDLGLVGMLALAVAVINAPGVVARWYDRVQRAAVDRLPALPPFGPDDRVLMVAPHPDDEVLAGGGLIQAAVAAGASVHVVWLTHGDGFWIDAAVQSRRAWPRPTDMLRLGRARALEARSATRLLGVPGENLFFLGYPDRGLLPMVARPRRTYRSPHTLRAEVPYAEARSPGAEYTAANLERDLEAVLEAVRPTLVLSPSPMDAHPDHRAGAAILTGLLTRRGESGQARFWIIHGGLEWPLPKGHHPDLPLAPAPRGRGLAWERLELSPAQVKVKAQAVGRHHSQTEVLSRFVAAFSRRNELFSAEERPARR